jgi:hypothetical protein
MNERTEDSDYLADQGPCRMTLSASFLSDLITVATRQRCDSKSWITPIVKPLACGGLCARMESFVQANLFVC